MKQLFSNRRFVGMLMLCLLWSCDPERESILRPDAEFFPLNVGLSSVYQVDETIYSQTSAEEKSYRLKLVVVDSFRSAEGVDEFVIYRYKQEGDSEWQYLDTWSARLSNVNLVVKEGATPFVKIAFPTSEGREWNGNALNSLGGNQNCESGACEIYELSGWGDSYSNEFGSYDDTITITQSNDIDAVVGDDVRIEVYARNVGLVYRENNVFEYCTVGDCIGQQQIITGYRFRQQLISFGDE